MKLGHDLWVGDGDVGPAVHDARLFNPSASSWGEVGGEFCWIGHFDGRVEEGFVYYLVAFCRECLGAVVLVPGLTSASSESASSAGAVWVVGLEQTLVLGSVDVEIP